LLTEWEVVLGILATGHRMDGIAVLFHVHADVVVGVRSALVSAVVVASAPSPVMLRELPTRCRVDISVGIPNGDDAGAGMLSPFLSVVVIKSAVHEELPTGYEVDVHTSFTLQGPTPSLALAPTSAVSGRQPCSSPGSALERRQW